MVPIRRRRRLPSRSAFVVSLLFLTLGLAGVMAYQAWDATRSHERIAKETLEGHALSAAWELTSAIRRELYGMYLDPGLEARTRLGPAYPDAPSEGLRSRAFEKILEDYAGGLVDGVLRFPLPDGFQEGEVGVPGGMNPLVRKSPSELLVSFLEGHGFRRSRKGRRSLPAGMRIHGRRERAGFVLCSSFRSGSTGAHMAFGFQTDLSPSRRLRRRSQRERPSAPGPHRGKKTPKSSFPMSVSVPSGREVFSPPDPQYPSEIEAKDTVGPLLGA